MIETLSQDQVAEEMRKLTDALTDLARIMADAVGKVVKALTKLLKYMRPLITLWGNERRALLHDVWVIFFGDPDPPRTWPEAKRIWRRHGG